MDRASLLLIGIVVCALGIAVDATAQAPVSPDGWVVLPVDEYRALRERALPQPPLRTSFAFGEQPRQIDFELRAGSLTEAITVMGDSPAIDVSTARRAIQPSENVVNLQRRTAGVLPVRVDVPRAGTSHRFMKPLVVDRETFVTLRYQRR